jgi:hypothetical protein
MRIAEIWAESRTVIDFRGELGLIVEDLDNPAAIPGLLRMTRMSSSEFYSYPTRLYNAFPHLNISLTKRDQRFVRNSNNIDKSISYLTWWIRSRLPGFPVLPVPQLARNAFHAKHDPDMPWTSDGLSAGIELRSFPTNCDMFLGVETGPAANQLRDAFAELPCWVEFGELSNRLDDATRSELVSAKLELEKKAQAAERETGNDFADPRIHWRRARELTAEAVAELSPFAAKFATTFDSVNSAINLVLPSVLAQLIAFGPPRHLTGVSELKVQPTDPATISFESESTASTSCLYWTDDSLIPDAVRIESVSFGGSQIHGNRSSASAVVLQQTSTAWSRDLAPHDR